MFENKIDKSQYIELKVPVHLPTIQDWTEYAEVVGQIQLKDGYYNYTRLKMTRDTMYFVCVPNTAKERLINANVIVAKEINDVPFSKKGEQPVMKKVTTVTEYNFNAFQYSYSAFGTYLKKIDKPVFIHLNEPFIESPGKPPNAIC
jgi:hypothetical protein